MKRILPLLICLWGGHAFAQGFFLQPEIGIGTADIHTNTRPVEWYPIMWMHPGVISPVMGYNGRLMAGYEWKRVAVSAGVGYIQSGYSQDYTGGEMIVVSGRLTEIYTHITVPVIATYKVPLGKHLFLSVGAGGEISRNTSSTVTNDWSTRWYSNKEKYVYKGSSFAETYERFSSLGNCPIEGWL